MEIQTFGKTSAPVPTVYLPVTDPTDTGTPDPPIPQNPVATFTYQTTDLSVSIDARSSTDGGFPQYPLTRFDVDWGDNQKSTSTTSYVPAHAYAAPGTYTITLVVTNSIGNTDSAFKPVTVTAPVGTNKPPVVAFVSTKNGLQITVTPTGTSDPDGTINNYNYSWDDGTTTSTSSSAAVNHTYAAGGTYKVVLTATDNGGATASTSHSIVVVAPSGASVRAPSTATPSKTVSFHPPTGQNMQNFQWDPVHNQWYLTQNLLGSNGTTSPYETCKIVRLASDGSYLDSMTLTDGGHGTSLVVENVGTKVYIWMTYQRPTTNSSVKDDIVRFPYTKGTFTRTKIPGLTVLPRMHSGYVNIITDWYANWMLMKTGNTYERRKISEYLKGINTVYGIVNSTSQVSGNTLQGYATMNDSLFVYTGAKNGERLSPPDPGRIFMYDWITGNLTDTVNVNSYGSDSSGNYPDDYHEAEGLTVTRDPKTHRASLMFGVNTGVWPSHNWWTWTYKNIGSTP